MKSKRLLVSLSLFLILVFVSLSILTGCSSSTPTTSAPTTSALTTSAPTTSAPTTSAPTTSALTTSAPTTPVKAVTLKMAPGGLPNDKSLFGGLEQFKSEVEKRTEGRVKIDIYYGQTLAGEKELTMALESGLADIIFPAPHHQPGQLPLYTLGNMPGLTSNYWAKAMAFGELMTTEQAFADECAKFGGVIIGASYYAPVGIISKSSIETLDQLKGKKISARSPCSDMLAKFDAVPLSIMPAEEYEAFLRGTVDAMASPINAVIDFKFYEIGKYFTFFNLGDRNHALIFSEKALAKLSPEDQKIITEDLAQEYTEMAYNHAVDGLSPAGMDIVEREGVTFNYPSDEDSARLLQAAEEMQEAWVTKMNGEGLPGTELMNKYKELVKKYEEISPY